MVTKKQAEDGHETIEHVAGKLHEVVDKAAEGLGKTEDRILKEAADTVEKVREGKEYARSQGEELLGTVTTYVRDNPLTALGIAFVAGSIFSSLNRRR